MQDRVTLIGGFVEQVAHLYSEHSCDGSEGRNAGVSDSSLNLTEEAFADASGLGHLGQRQLTGQANSTQATANVKLV